MKIWVSYSSNSRSYSTNNLRDILFLYNKILLIMILFHDWIQCYIKIILWFSVLSVKHVVGTDCTCNRAQYDITH